MATIMSALGDRSVRRRTRIARTKVPQTDDFTGITAVVRLRARNCVAPRLGFATQQVPDPAARSQAGHSPAGLRRAPTTRSPTGRRAEWPERNPVGV